MILIGDKHRITFQTNSFDLEEQVEVTNKETKEKSLQWTKVSYHPNLKLAFKNAFREKLITEKNITDINEIEKYLKSEIDKFIKTLKIEK